ncbi:MAG: response regulator [Dictyoglomus sp.]|nr:response regulator [Dictyoglomus sp.]MDW8189203.1 response regulator [Dictyoglomus sp.]
MKILLIDDSSLARRLLRKILEKENHEIIEAGSGMEGLEKYYLEKPDVVFLDLTMEGLYGLDVLEKIKEIDPSAKVIVASADIQKQTKNLALEKGAFAFINKPFNEEEILDVLRKV